MFPAEETGCREKETNVILKKFQTARLAFSDLQLMKLDMAPFPRIEDEDEVDGRFAGASFFLAGAFGFLAAAGSFGADFAFLAAGWPTDSFGCAASFAAARFESCASWGAL